jgi:hypothetical protein
MRWFACGVLALGALGSVQSAGAVTLLEDGNTLVVGDATIIVSNCPNIVFCQGDLQIAAAPGPNIGFVIESATDPSASFLPSGGFDDLTVMFEIVTATQDITSIGLSATGAPHATVGETITDGFCTLNTGSPTVGVGSSTSISLSAGYSLCGSSTERDIFVTKNIHADGGSVISVTQYINAVGAPEPLSASVLAVGLLGLAAVRRRAR